MSQHILLIVAEGVHQDDTSALSLAIDGIILVGKLSFFLPVFALIVCYML